MSQKIEERLADIEKEVQQIKAQLKADRNKSNWITETKGAFRGDPYYAEIVRLGKGIRDAEELELDE